MNCFEFRKLCLSNPGSRDPDYLAHREACPTCAAFAERQAVFDRRLESAMRVSVPSHLGPRAVLNQRLRSHRSRHVMAIAASLLGALAIFLGLQAQTGGPPLDEALASHVTKDPIHEEAPAAWRSRDFARLVSEIGGRVTASIPGVVEATYCPINDKPGAHFVLEGRKGPIVAFLLPQHSLPEARKAAADGLEGEIVPTQHGVVALFGRPGERLAERREQLVHRIRWKS